MPNCVVCGNPDASGQSGVGDFMKFKCPRCGTFALTNSAIATLPSRFRELPIRRAIMSHTLRRMQRHANNEQRHIFDSQELDTLWKGRLPTPQEQAEYFILWIGDSQSTPFEWVEATPTEIAATVGAALAPAGDSQAWSWLHSQLGPKNLYRIKPLSGKDKIQLTLLGWEKYENLKRSKIESRLAFMALKFGQTDLDPVVENCFRPAVARTGFELRLLTDDQPAGLIDDQLRAAILAARFVISDLTHGSPGAYWEAGYAEGLGMPVIYTCEKTAWEEKKTHFDTNHLVTVIWDPSDLEKAGNLLTATIRATLRGDAKQTD
jgi:nucleoside 2-deoxyribosyltransferase